MGSLERATSVPFVCVTVEGNWYGSMDLERGLVVRSLRNFGSFCTLPCREMKKKTHDRCFDFNCPCIFKTSHTILGFLNFIASPILVVLAKYEETIQDPFARKIVELHCESLSEVLIFC